MSSQLAAARRRSQSDLLRLGRLALLVVAAGAGAGPALASLGGTYASVEADSVQMVAKRATAAAATHMVHSLVLPNGGVAREFARRDGVVFAVSWRGPGRPDLRQLLGDYFGAMQADNARAGRLRRLPLSVNRSDFILRSGGHPGAFWGMAYVPQLVPAGFSSADME